MHSDPKSVNFRQVSSLGPNFFTCKNGDYTTDLMKLLSGLNENKCKANSAILGSFEVQNKQ